MTTHGAPSTDTGARPPRDDARRDAAGGRRQRRRRREADHARPYGRLVRDARAARTGATVGFEAPYVADERLQPIAPASAARGGPQGAAARGRSPVREMAASVGGATSNAAANSWPLPTAAKRGRRPSWIRPTSGSGAGDARRSADASASSRAIAGRRRPPRAGAGADHGVCHAGARLGRRTPLPAARRPRRVRPRRRGRARRARRLPAVSDALTQNCYRRLSAALPSISHISSCFKRRSSACSFLSSQPRARALDAHRGRQLLRPRHAGLERHHRHHLARRLRRRRAARGRRLRGRREVPVHGRICCSAAAAGATPARPRRRGDARGDRAGAVGDGVRRSAVAALAKAEEEERRRMTEAEMRERLRRETVSSSPPARSDNKSSARRARVNGPHAAQIRALDDHGLRRRRRRAASAAGRRCHHRDAASLERARKRARSSARTAAAERRAGLVASLPERRFHGRVRRRAAFACGDVARVVDAGPTARRP